MNRTSRFGRPNLPGLAASIGAAIAAAAGGCASTQYDNDFFDYDPQQSRTRAVLDAQYALGAMDDKTLSSRHFDLEDPDIQTNGAGLRVSSRHIVE